MASETPIIHNKAAEILPYGHSRESKTRQIEQMFDNISGNYDVLNRLCSLGIDRHWRNKAIAVARKENPKLILDIATGTADLAIEMAKQLQPQAITGLDLSENMLRIGREKVQAQGLSGNVELVKGNCEALAFADGSFDLVTASFGVRNFENLGKGIGEMQRVLKPNGLCMILELSRPRNFLFKAGFWLYFKTIVPALGRFISKDQSAYSYLPSSVAAFPEGKDFLEVMRQAGFAQTSLRQLTFGICTIYLGRKK